MTDAIPRSGGPITANVLNMAFRGILDRNGGVDAIDADEGTSSVYNVGGFVDLSTRGPEVSVTSRGLRALVFIACKCWNPSGAANTNLMAVQVTNVDGVVTHAATLNSAMIQQGTTLRNDAKRTWIMLPFNLAENGPHTFTAKYSAGAGTATFSNRSMAVLAP